MVRIQSQDVLNLISVNLSSLFHQPARLRALTATEENASEPNSLFYSMQMPNRDDIFIDPSPVQFEKKLSDRKYLRLSSSQFDSISPMS
jgi:hypothetical protein